MSRCHILASPTVLKKIQDDPRFWIIAPQAHYAAETDASGKIVVEEFYNVLVSIIDPTLFLGDRTWQQHLVLDENGSIVGLRPDRDT